MSNLAAQPDGKGVKLSFSMKNIGKRAGKGVSQVYVSPADWKKAGWEAPKRLGAFAKSDLKSGQTKDVELSVDPRLLATYEAANNNWHIKAGSYRIMVGQASDGQMQTAEVALPDTVWSACSACKSQP